MNTKKVLFTSIIRHYKFCLFYLFWFYDAVYHILCFTDNHSFKWKTNFFVFALIYWMIAPIFMYYSYKFYSRRNQKLTYFLLVALIWFIALNFGEYDFILPTIIYVLSIPKILVRLYRKLFC